MVGPTLIHPERLPVYRRNAIAIAVLVLAGFAGSCASTSSQDGPGPSSYAAPPSHPARIGLQPIYRPFFDELKDEGDWTLIEPYGWCFRPRVNFVAWRPYLEGWWEPSDYWGWIWNTNEPYGWVTYHYGAWFYDSYQGWVWQPGPVWGPAWVAWVAVGDYVGWAPLGPSQWDGFGEVPGGMFTFAGARQLASRDVGQQALYLTRLPETNAPARAIVNVGRANGVAFNRGPDFLMLQQMGAPIPERIDGATLPRVRLGTAAAKPNEADLLARTNRVTAEAVREWRALREQGIAPPALPPGVRTPGKPPVPAAKPPTPPTPARKPGSGDAIHDVGTKPASEPGSRDSTATGSRPERREHADGPARPADRDTTRDR